MMINASIARGRTPVTRPIDDPAYEALFRAEVTSMIRLAALLGADDPENVAQEAFMRLHDRWPSVRDSESPVAYLRTVVVNLVRSRQRHLRVVHRHLPHQQTDAASAEDMVVMRAENTWLMHALDSLAPRRREVLVLRYWLDLSEAQIAEVMNTSAGTVKSQLSRGLTNLREALAGLQHSGGGLDG